MKRILIAAATAVAFANPAHAADDPNFFGFCTLMTPQSTWYVTPLFELTRNAVPLWQTRQNIYKSDGTEAPNNFQEGDINSQFQTTVGPKLGGGDEDGGCVYGRTKEIVRKWAIERRDFLFGEEGSKVRLDQDALRNWRPKADAKYPFVVSAEDIIF